MEALFEYLTELLIFRGHFNIDDELAVGNIEKHKKSVESTLYKTPYLTAKLENLNNTDKIFRAINQLKELSLKFAEKLERDYLLFKSYQELWDEKLKASSKGKRGRVRQDIHMKLFTERLWQILKERNLPIKINEDINICYLDNGKVFFPNTFIEVIDAIENINSTNDSFFYRGHENSSYRLIPSIYRGTSPFYEKELLYDAINLLPDEVRGATSNFEILTKLQHFGTPTRLLDITTNPLVALYFACMNTSHNGEVLCYSVEKDKIKLFDSDTVSILANLSKMKYDFNIDRIYRKSLKDFNDEKIIRELVHKIRNEKSYFDNVVVADDLMKSFFVTSKLDNPRIIRQSGAFIICGMDKYKLSPSPEIYEFERDVIRRIIISKRLKTSFKKSLDIFNISSGSLFPDLSEVSQYIKSKYGL